MPTFTFVQQPNVQFTQPSAVVFRPSTNNNQLLQLSGVAVQQQVRETFGDFFVGAPTKSDWFQVQDAASSDDELHIHYHLNNVNDANVQMDQRPQMSPGGHQGYGLQQQQQQQQQQQPQANPAIPLAVVQPIIQQA